MRAYFSALNAIVMGKPATTLQPFFNPTCSICQSTWNGVQLTQLKGQSFRGGALVVESIGPVTVSSSGAARVITVTSENAGEILATDGSVLSSFKTQLPSKVAYTLQPSGSTWLISASQIVS
jgi:hypothetical protein